MRITLALLAVLLCPLSALAQGSFGLGVGPGYGNATGYSSAFPGAAQVPSQGYGGASVSGGYGSGYGGGLAAGVSSFKALEVSRGDTIFSGLSLLHDPLEQVDLHLLYNQSITLAQNSAAYADAANQRANTIIQQHMAYAGRVAEIRAQTVAAATAMQAVGSVGIQASATVGSAGGAAVLPPIQAAPQSYPVPSQLPAQPRPTSVLIPSGGGAQQICNSKCVQCHNPSDSSAGLDLSDLSRLNENQARSILERITHADPARRMPLGSKAGDPGQPLEMHEITAFFQAVQR
jgi:hypothetical protein